MTFNKSQKKATVVYVLLIIIILLALTPCYHQINGYTDTDDERVANFFLVDTKRIIFKKLFFELGVLSLIYYLSLIIFKNKS
jgi:hypothetical protein